VIRTLREIAKTTPPGKKGVRTMLKQKIQSALNEQINAEFYSSYLYLAMATSCQSKSLVGMAQWLRVQAQEEIVHAMKFIDYLTNCASQVSLVQIAGPPIAWESPLKIFQDALAHEQAVTARIQKLMDLATQENDHTTAGFLQWFLDEQIEEEASANQIVNQLKLIGTSGSGLFLLDRELAQRTFSAGA